ncbi:MAG: hypothetical protein DYH08_16445 [Actinobacteria bacterium ATB1]|nr:hypothetical protein [Actinobacteria bacterium ATB1]
MDHYLESQIRTIESRLDRIEQELGLVPDGPAISDLVAQLAHDGKMLDAIRVYRDETGADLAAAKEVVESIPR